MLLAGNFLVHWVSFFLNWISESKFRFICCCNSEGIIVLNMLPCCRYYEIKIHNGNKNQNDINESTILPILISPWPKKYNIRKFFYLNIYKKIKTHIYYYSVCLGDFKLNTKKEVHIGTFSIWSSTEIRLPLRGNFISMKLFSITWRMRT